MASPSGPRSGKHAAALGITNLRNWTLNRINALETRYHSATRGGPARQDGVNDWNGTVESFGGFPDFFPGDYITGLSLFEGPDDSVYGHTGVTWTGNAIVDYITINWNFQPNQSLNWSAGFSAHGAIVDGTGVVDDVSDDCPDRICDLHIDHLDPCIPEVAYTEWLNVESAILTIRAANVPYVNSTTACETFRRSGNIDFTFDITDQEDYTIVDLLADLSLRAYITASAYWELNYAKLQNFSNIRADRETGAIKNKTNNFVMNGFLCCTPGSGASTIGSIIDPDGVTQWPIAIAE